MVKENSKHENFSLINYCILFIFNWLDLQLSVACQFSFSKVSKIFSFVEIFLLSLSLLYICVLFLIFLFSSLVYYQGRNFSLETTVKSFLIAQYPTLLYLSKVFEVWTFYKSHLHGKQRKMEIFAWMEKSKVQL